jgi:iron(III) transport system permease protein
MQQMTAAAARSRLGGWPSPLGWLVDAWRFDRAKLVIGLLVLVLGFVVLYPIGSVIYIGLHPAGGDAPAGFGAWTEAFREPGMLTSILNTVKVVSATQAIGLPAAIVIAWFLARTNVPFSRWLEFGFWILYFLPSLAVTTGWLLFFDKDYGLVNRWLLASGLVDSPPFDMYSYWGIVFAHITTYAIAVKVMLLTPAFRNLDGAIEEASRVCGASAFTTLVRIVIPLLAPAIIVVFLMSLIRGLEAFEIELFLGMPINFAVYSTKIFTLMHEDPPRFAPAGVLATSVLAMMIPLLVAQRWASTRRSSTVVTGQALHTLTDLGRWRWPAFAVLLAIVCFFSLVPLGLLVTGSFMKLFGFFDLPEIWSLEHWVTLFNDTSFVSGFHNMLLLGAGTALCAVLAYAVVAYCTVRLHSRLQAPLDILTWLPLTIPGIILSFGYLYMVLQVPVFRPLYGTMYVMVLVSVLGSMTLGVQMIKVHMLQIGAEVEEASRVAGGSWTQTFGRIITPLTAPALAVVAVIVFAGAIRQVSSIIMLSTGDTRVLSILQLEYLSEGELGPAAVAGVVIVLMSLLAAAVIRIISVRFGVAARG